MIFNESLKNVTSTWLTGTKLVKLNNVLFNALVPKRGAAATSAGKKLQSANRVLYATPGTPMRPLNMNTIATPRIA